MAYEAISDKDLFALCIWREARGEPEEGQRAVAHVIVNRQRAWNIPLRTVILQKNQFSSMTFPKDSQLNLYPKYGDKRYAKILEIIDTVLDGSDPDPTGGALYYANLEIANSPWFQRNVVEKMTHTVKIGRHNFYRP